MRDIAAARALASPFVPSSLCARTFEQEGLDAALQRKNQALSSRDKMFDGQKDAILVAFACGAKPKGQVRWTFRFLAERGVEQRLIGYCSPQSI